MYTIFDLAFDKKSRTSRLLYSILHAETRCLTNSVRFLIKEKNIDIFAEQQYQHQIIQNFSSNISTTLTNKSLQQHQIVQSPSNNSITPIDESQQQSQSQISSQDGSSVQHNPLVIPQISETTSTNDENLNENQ